MRKTRFTEEQMAFALRAAGTETPADGVCRKMGISQQTCFWWKKKYAGLDVAELRRLKQLVTDPSPDKIMLQDILSKKP